MLQPFCGTKIEQIKALRFRIFSICAPQLICRRGCRSLIKNETTENLPLFMRDSGMVSNVCFFAYAQVLNKNLFNHRH